MLVYKRTFQGQSGHEHKRLMGACKRRHAVTVVLQNYTKSKVSITNHLSVTPCDGDTCAEVNFLCVSVITHATPTKPFINGDV